MKKLLLIVMLIALVMNGCGKQDDNTDDVDEVLSGTYELIMISEYDEDADVVFDMPGANNDVSVTVSKEIIADFSLGDVVEIQYTEKQVCDADNPNKCMMSYELVSIKEGSGLYTEGYTLSEILGFVPVKAEICEPKWTEEDEAKELVLEAESEIQDFLSKMDTITIYKDCVEVYGAGEPIYTMKFYSEDGELVEVKDSFNVEVSYSDSEMVFGIHRTEEDSLQYSSLLQKLFEE